MSLLALKGFANFRVFPITTNTSSSYVPEATGSLFVGARSLTPTDNRNEYEIPGDDTTYAQGSDYKSTALKVTVNEATLTQIAAMTGATLTEGGVLMEYEADTAPELALSFSALRVDGGYRLYQYFNAKLSSHVVALKAKLDNGNEVSQYELNFVCKGRLLDKLVRATEDIASGAAMTWLETILGAVKYTVTYDKGTGTSGTDPDVVYYTAGQQVITLANPYLKTDQTFTGWLSSGAGTPTYDESHAFIMPAANITLTAQWTA